MTVRQNTLPCIATMAMAIQVTLLQKIVALANILLTNINMDNLVSVQAAANMICAVRTILSPVVT